MVIMQEPAGVVGLVDFAHLLSHELTEAGLIPAGSGHRTSRATWERHGAAHWRAVHKAVSPYWTQANRLLPSPLTPADCARMLGLGAAVTSYAGRGSSERFGSDRRVVELGALANFIVAIYDQFVDDSVVSADALPREYVARIGRRQPARRSDSWRRVGPVSALFAELVGEYDRRLTRLAGRSGSPMLDHVRRVIVAMYDAERQSLGISCSRHQLRRRAALPLVVMGLPFWLTIREPRPLMVSAHARWLYRVGSFLGWIDDAVDLAEDSVAGRPNLVASALSADRSAEAGHRLATRIAQRGQALHEEWRQFNTSGHSHGSDEVDGLALVVCSWLDRRLT